VTPSSNRYIWPSSGTAVAFLALKPKNILAEFIQLETQIGDHMVFSDSTNKVSSYSFL
jgi:hypothetical protein